MDYVYLQLLILIGFVLCMINAVGCIQYLSHSSTMSISQSPCIRYIFGVSGLLLLISSIFVLLKIESSF